MFFSATLICLIRERELLPLVAAGLVKKQVAVDLGRGSEENNFTVVFFGS